MPRTAQEQQAAGGRTAFAQRPPTAPTRSPDAQRPRRGKGVKSSCTHRSGHARTAAGEDAGRASQAPAGETAGDGSTIAQSPSVCSPRRPNSRQRRSANRLVEYIRSKQAPQAAAEPALQVAERPSPKRAHENGAREGGDAADAAAASQRRRIVDVDYEARQEAAAALYTAWRQYTLSTTNSPANARSRAIPHFLRHGRA